jgi:uncharacterized membrane protein
MKYYLNSNDEGKVDYLIGMASFILKKLQIGFTAAYLEKAVVEGYQDVYDSQEASLDKQHEVSVADRNDPVNLVVALSSTLIKFHVKSEVCDAPPVSKDGVTLKVYSVAIAGTQAESLIADWDGGLTAVGQTATLSIEGDGQGETLFVNYKKNMFSGEPMYAESRAKVVVEKWVRLLILFVILAATGMALYNGTQQYNIFYWLPSLLLLAAGVFVCYHIFKVEKLNAQDSVLVKKFCSGKQASNTCKAVLSSKGAKLFTAISMGDIGMVYFATLFCYLTHALLSGYYTAAMGVYGWCILVALPFSLYSLYYQWKVLKQFCKLCVLIQLLLWAQFIWLLCILPQVTLFSFSSGPSIQFCLIAALITGLYFFVVRYYAEADKTAKLLQQLRPYNKDMGVFKLLLQREAKLHLNTLGGALLLGSQTAPKQLQVVLSLGCMPCGNMLNSLVKLADRLADTLCIQLFVKPEENAPYLWHSFYTFTTAGQNKEALALLTDWYGVLASEKEPAAQHIQQWRSPMPDNNGQVIAQGPLVLVQDWFNKQDIPYTPLLVYEGHFLPSQYYDMDLLAYMIEIEAEQG